MTDDIGPDLEKLAKAVSEPNSPFPPPFQRREFPWDRPGYLIKIERENCDKFGEMAIRDMPGGKF
ncbi:MAG: hypothetical protein ABSB32_13580 [Thermodesulfobacteriota bacterium]|jgi:hypothetical protein